MMAIIRLTITRQSALSGPSPLVGKIGFLVKARPAPPRVLTSTLYSLIETAKANGLNVRDCLKLIFKELPNAQAVKDIEVLLPLYVSLGQDGLRLTFTQDRLTALKRDDTTKHDRATHWSSKIISSTRPESSEGHSR